MDKMIKIPLADNVLPIVSDCGYLIVDGVIDGEYAYVPAHVLDAEHFAFAHEILNKYPIAEYPDEVPEL